MAWRGRAVRLVRSVPVGRCRTSDGAIAGTSVLVASGLRAVTAASGRSVRTAVRGARRWRGSREPTRSWRTRSVGHTPIALVALLAVPVACSSTAAAAELVATTSEPVASVAALSTVSAVVTWRAVLATTTVTVVAVPTATATAHSVLGHFHQLRVDDLVGLAQHVDQVAGLVRVGVGEQRVGGSGVVRAARTSDPVDVILRVGRVVVVDDELYIFDVCLRFCFGFFFSFECVDDATRKVFRVCI